MRKLWAARQWEGLAPDAHRVMVVQIEVDLINTADDGRDVKWPQYARLDLTQQWRQALSAAMDDDYLTIVDPADISESTIPVRHENIPEALSDALLSTPSQGATHTLAPPPATDLPSGEATHGRAFDTGHAVRPMLNSVAAMTQRLDADAAVWITLKLKLDAQGRLVLRPGSVVRVEAGYYPDPTRPLDPVTPRHEAQLTLSQGVRGIHAVAHPEPRWLVARDTLYADEALAQHWQANQDTLHQEARALFNQVATTVVRRLRDR